MSVLTLNVNEVMRTLSAESSNPFVAHDKEVDIVRFAINSGFADIVLDGQVALRVMYQRPRETEVRAQTLTYYDTDGLHNYYDWQLSQSDLAKNGSLMAALCILDISGGEVSEWHTTPCAVRVLSTIHTDDSDEGDDTITPTVKERVAVLETMIQRVASGAPIVVASTSAMTDTSQIYVLSTNGRWYYHNGTAWVAGGTYGAVPTDTTLTQSGIPADAKMVGDKVTNLMSDLSDVFNGVFSVENIGLNSSKASRGISNTGLGAWDGSKTTYFYPVTPGELIYLKLNANTGATTAIWEFNTVGEMGSMTASTLVGDVHFDAIDGNVRVPSGAAYVVVAQDTSVTNFVVGSVQPISYQSQIDDIKYGAYEPISGSFEIGSILNGVNSTTTTRVRHISPVSYNRDIFLFVKSGYKYYVAFYSDAAGSTYLYTRQFVTNDLPIIISANSYFRLVICKTTEEAVTDIDIYVKSLYVTTQLFNNPQIYRNPLVRQIAHQGLSGKPNASTGYCLKESYIYAAIAGFTHGECDIVFTSDGVPVCCHDATFTDATSGNTVTIANETYADLILHDYHGSTIASFDEVVKTCKTYGMGVYVDHINGSWTSAQWRALFDVVQKYDMAKNTIWLIPAVSPLTSGVIQAWYSDANFSRVFTSVPSDFASAVTAMKGLKTASNAVSIDLPTASIAAEDMPTYTAQLVPEVNLEVWCADTIEDWFAYLPYVSGITSNRVCANIARQFA